MARLLVCEHKLFHSKLWSWECRRCLRYRLRWWNQPNNASTKMETIWSRTTWGNVYCRVGKKTIAPNWCKRLHHYPLMASPPKPIGTPLIKISAGFVSMKTNQTVSRIAHDIKEKLVFCWRKEKRKNGSTITFYESDVKLTEREQAVLQLYFNKPITIPIFMDTNGYLSTIINGYKFTNFEVTMWQCVQKRKHGCNAYFYATLYNNVFLMHGSPHSSTHAHNHDLSH